MSEYVTIPNVLVAFSILGNIFALFKLVAPLTKTTVDDDAVAANAQPYRRTGVRGRRGGEKCGRYTAISCC